VNAEVCERRWGPGLGEWGLIAGRERQQRDSPSNREIHFLPFDVGGLMISTGTNLCRQNLEVNNENLQARNLQPKLSLS